MFGMNWGAQSTSPLAAARLAPSLPANASMRMPSICCFSGCQYSGFLPRSNDWDWKFVTSV